jgi:DNA-binding Lrp family transcriptional regulator
MITATQRKILSVLDKKARISFAKIGKLTSLPKSVVNYNVNSLQEKGVIKGFATLIDYSALGFSEFRVYINLFKNKSDTEFVDYLKQLKSVGVLVRCIGDYDLVVSFYVKDVVKFWNEWFFTLEQFNYLIRDYSFNFVVEKSLLPFFVDSEDRVASVVGRKTLQKYDGIDLTILSQLNLNCRKPIHEIANLIDKSSSVVISRIKKLESLGVITGYYTIFDFTKIGREFCRVQFRLEKLNDSFFSFLKLTPVVLSYGKILGADLEVDFLVSNLNELLTTIENMKINFPGLIREYKYLRVIDTYKWNHLPEL